MTCGRPKGDEAMATDELQTAREMQFRRVRVLSRNPPGSFVMSPSFVYVYVMEWLAI